MAAEKLELSNEIELQLANSFVIFLLNSLHIATGDPKTTIEAMTVWKTSVEKHLKNDKKMVKELSEKTGDTEDVAQILINIHNNIYFDIINTYTKKIEYLLGEIQKEKL